jgi:hypothetical protein
MGVGSFMSRQGNEATRKGDPLRKEYCITADGVTVIALKWYDSKPVLLLSSFVGASPVWHSEMMGSETKGKC